MVNVNKDFDFLHYLEDEDYVVIIDEKEKSVSKYVIDLIDDAPLVDVELWAAQDVYYRHLKEIQKEGGFMDD